VSTLDLSGARWRKSSWSNSNSNCVEVAGNLPDAVAVRDSKDPAGAVLFITPAQWRAFAAEVKAGESDLFDLPV
jgi:hypothetical protein